MVVIPTVNPTVLGSETFLFFLFSSRVFMDKLYYCTSPLLFFFLFVLFVRRFVYVLVSFFFFQVLYTPCKLGLFPAIIYLSCRLFSNIFPPARGILYHRRDRYPLSEVLTCPKEINKKTEFAELESRSREER